MIKQNDIYIRTGYKIIFNQNELDLIFMLTPEIKKLLKITFKKVVNKKKNAVGDLKLMIEKYPHIPQFKNYLFMNYFNEGNKEKASEINHLLVKEHPEYVFGKINLAIEYLDKKQHGKVPEILGKEMEISSLYPKRKIFHAEEVLSFNEVAAEYFIKSGNIDQAEIRLKFMIDVDPDNPKTVNARKLINIYHMKKYFEESKKDTGSFTKPKIFPKNKYKQLKTEPVFINPEVKQLYQFGFQIDFNIIKNMLELSRETLIEDLKKVIIDSIVRYKYFYYETEWTPYSHNFLLHALLMLRELKAEEALDAVLDLLSQDGDLLDYWLSDSLIMDIWSVVYQLGQNKLVELKDFMLSGNISTYAKTTVNEALCQIATDYPDRRFEVINWYYYVLNYFIEHKGVSNLIDPELIGLTVDEIFDLNAIELEDTIRKLYALNIIDTEIIGELDSCIKELKKKHNKFPKSLYKSLEEIYKEYSESEKQTEKYFLNKSAVKNNEISQTEYKSIPEEYKGTGRNEKCPCGSGLKFKKCHGK